LTKVKINIIIRKSRNPSSAGLLKAARNPRKISAEQVLSNKKIITQSARFYNTKTYRERRGYLCHRAAGKAFFKGGVGLGKIVVGFSGGVDSSVTAKLLEKRGYEVVPVFLDGGFSDAENAQRSAAALDVPLVIKDIKEEIEKKVIGPFTNAYLNGETPNPCVMCNPLVKFATLIAAAEEVGSHKIATGHYARVRFDGENAFLCRALSLKDQSYMLYRLSQDVLRRCVFPLGEFRSKDEVRNLAREFGLPSAETPDSMEICFIKDGDHAAFIEKRAGAPKDGNFVDEDGKILGRHLGIHRYTVGQRRGLDISASSRLYVSEIDAVSGNVVLSDRDVFKSEIDVKNTVFAPGFGKEPFSAGVKVRYSKNEWAGEVFPDSSASRARVRFKTPARAPARGQSAVFYAGDTVAGGGIIE